MTSALYALAIGSTLFALGLVARIREARA